MSYHHLLLVFHLLAATIWVGGHLLLLISYVPLALKEKSKHIILNFESKYERLGISSLAILVITGIAMAVDYGVMPVEWFYFQSPLERVVSIKLLFLLITILFALSARFSVIPKLKAGDDNLLPLVYHIASVTAIGVMMLLFGSFIRYGGL